MKSLLAVSKAFADPTRLRILYALRAGERCVCELGAGLDLIQSTLSSHLQYLRLAGLVETRNEGKWVYYALERGFARVARTLFRLHAAELEADPVLSRDAVRLQDCSAGESQSANCPARRTRPGPRRRPVSV